MARANSKVQHINMQQDESIFISWNLIKILEDKENQEEHRGDNINVLRKNLK